jgi:hypothetical protein
VAVAVLDTGINHLLVMRTDEHFDAVLTGIAGAVQSPNPARPVCRADGVHESERVAVC